MRKQASLGFVDPENVQNGTSVANGSLARIFGSLNPPSVGYAAFSPQFHWDGELFIGGQFWNGRAKDLVEQAKMPFLNPVEMAMPTEWSVIERLQENNQYKKLFKKIFGIKLKKLRKGVKKLLMLSKQSPKQLPYLKGVVFLIVLIPNLIVKLQG